MTDDKKKEYEDILFNKISRNIRDIKDKENMFNNSFSTEPNKKYLKNEINSTIKKMKNNNEDNSTNSNNNNSLIKEINLIYNSGNILPKTDNKQQLEDQKIDYTDFLQKQFSVNLKNEENEDTII